MKPTSADIREYLQKRIAAHFAGGGISIDIRASDLWNKYKVDGLTGVVPICLAMRTAQAIYPNRVLYSPPSGNSTGLEIRYYKDVEASAADGADDWQPKEKDSAKREVSAPREIKSKTNLPRPTIEEVQFYLKSWDGLNNYVKQERALSKLFHKTYPKNNVIDEVLVKVCALNAFYSTNIFDVFRVAEHIVRLNIDEELQNGDLRLVEKIARIDDKSNNNYSFATKYCSHHFADKYAIYDSFVHKVLVYFRKVDGFFDFTDSDLKLYPIFHKAILAFRKFYGLEQFSIKDIDKYLWQLGKKHFPKTYGKKKGDA